MVIQLAIDTAEPLVGSATNGSCAPVPFVGWLDLLRAVSALVCTHDADTCTQMATDLDRSLDETGAPSPS